MYKQKASREGRIRRHTRVRAKVSGTGSRPRLCVFRSLEHMYAQIIDDVLGRTLTAASTLSPDIKSLEEQGKKTHQATAVGKLIASQAKALGIEQVVFDRGGYRYHGRVKALAEGAREGGLVF
jgi:large subunit ribosomal protein L18